MKHDKEGVPKPKAQRNFTDPESRIMESGGSYLQGFNCQVAVAESHQVIVAQLLTNQPPDYEHLMPLLEQTRANLDGYPDVLTADAGYWGEENGQFCEDKGIDTFISTRRRKHREHHDRDDEARPPPPPAAKTERGKAMEEKVMSDMCACLSSTFGFRDDLLQRVWREPLPRVQVYLDAGLPNDNHVVTREMFDTLVARA